MRKIFLAVVFVGFFGLVSTVNAARSDIPAPILSSPSNGGTADMPVELKWRKVSFPGGLSGGYFLELQGSKIPQAQKRVWVSTNSYSVPSSIQLFANDPTRIAPTLVVGEEHRWRVRACLDFVDPNSPTNQEQVCGPWGSGSDFWKFTPALKKPVLKSPVNSITQPAPIEEGGFVKLEWEKAPGATHYRLVVDKIAEPGSFTVTPEDILISGGELEGYLLQPEFVYQTHTYKWTVAAIQVIQDSTQVGQTSDEWRFVPSIGAPILLSPQQNAKFELRSSGNMDLEWSEVANVSRYEVDIFGPDNYFTNTKVSSNLLRVPFQNLSFGEYSWQVRACKDDIRGIPCGPSGGPRSFTITLPKPEVFNQTVPRSTAPSFGIEWTTPANTERGAFKVGALADLWEVRDSRKLLFSGKKTPTMITNVVEVPALQNLLPKDYALRVKVCTLDEKTCSDWSQAILTVNDGVPPSVLKFNASPLKITVKDPTLTITYGVSDVTFLGNPPASGIARVELWRRLFDKDSTVNDWGDWDEIDRNTGASKTGTFTDKFKVGIEEKYEYGLHVVDNSGNCITQEGERCFTKERVLTSTGLPVIRVEVDTKIESCTISIESIKYLRFDGEKGGSAKLIADVGGQTDIKAYIWNLEDDGVTHRDTEKFVDHNYNPGSYPVTLKLEDEAGNISDACTKKVNIDAKSPSIRTFTVEPDAPDWANKNTDEIKLSWDIRDTGGSGLVKEIKIWTADVVVGKCDNGNEAGCSWTITTLGSSSDLTNPDNWNGQGGISLNNIKKDGLYWIGISGKDKAGNESENNTKNIIEAPTKWKKVQVDKTPPDVSEFDVKVSPKDNNAKRVNIENPNVEISWEVKNADLSNLKQIEVWRAYRDEKPDKDEWGNKAIHTKKSGFTGTDLNSDVGEFIDKTLKEDGTYWYGLHAVDKAGNVGFEREPIKVVVDKIPPSCKLTVVATKGLPTERLLVVSDLQEDKLIVIGDAAEYAWDFDGGGKIDQTTELVSIKYDYKKEGQYNTKVKVTDKAGNTATCGKKVKVGPLPPKKPGDPCNLDVQDSCGKRTTLVCQPSDDDNFPVDLNLNIGACTETDFPGSEVGKDCTSTACPGVLVCNAKKECEIPPPTIGQFSNPLGSKNFADVLNIVLNFIFNIALVVAPLTILYAAFMFVTGGGNPEQISKAKKTLIWTIIGFLVILASRGIVFVIQDILNLESGV